MEPVVHELNEMLNERGPFQVAYEPLILKLPHPGEQKAYLVRVQFPEQRQPLCRLKIEITVDEPILTPVDTRPVLHGFAEDIEAHIPVYSLAEIIAEKLRALLQSKARLHEKGWGASRVCRDYYDLWNSTAGARVKIAGSNSPASAEMCCQGRFVCLSARFYIRRSAGCRRFRMAAAASALCAGSAFGCGAFTAGAIFNLIHMVVTLWR